MLQLIDSRLFTGLAHPDSVKCFKYFPSFDLTPIYELLAKALRNNNMYAEQSGGLALNYGYPTLGMNDKMLNIFKQRGVTMLTASDAHRPEDVGANLSEMAVALVT